VNGRDALLRLAYLIGLEAAPFVAGEYGFDRMLIQD
jgi:hypothetical protein